MAYTSKVATQAIHNQVMQQVAEQVAGEMEKALDEEIEKLDNLTEDDYAILRSNEERGHVEGEMEERRPRSSPRAEWGEGIFRSSQEEVCTFLFLLLLLLWVCNDEFWSLLTQSTLVVFLSFLSDGSCIVPLFPFLISLLLLPNLSPSLSITTQQSQSRSDVCACWKQARRWSPGTSPYCSGGAPGDSLCGIRCGEVSLPGGQATHLDDSQYCADHRSEYSPRTSSPSDI